MPLKKILFLFCLALSIAAALAVWLAPVAVAGGLRLWLRLAAREQNLRIEVEKIEAPFLRPAVLSKVQIAGAPDAPFRLNAEAARVELDLNLAAIFRRSRERVLRSTTAEGISVDIRRNPPHGAVSPRFDWRILQNLLADNFKLSRLELHVENGSTVVDLHEVTLSGAEIESGIFTAREIAVASPWFHKTFSQLRGATSWQESRLTIGALTFMRGLDLDALTIDCSRIGDRRIGFEMNVDAFGGKLRASVSGEDRAEKRIWDAAGTASEVSLTRMSDALDLIDRASGSLHACKFTFRGDATNLRDATAVVWAEVTGLTWRDRTADMIMIGASLNNREVQIEQLYVKQRDNQLTLSGESALPQNSLGWLNPEFRGDISASINDLGEFARLFGGRAADFAGTVSMEGTVDSRAKKLGGQLIVSGNSMVLFGAPVDSLKAKLTVKESQLAVEQFDLYRKNDFLRGTSNVNLAGDHSYSATLTSSVAELADYAGLARTFSSDFQLGGALLFDWAGNGKDAEHSGSFHARAHNLRALDSSLIPLEAEFEGNYSPDNIFFRQFHISNQHVGFSAFVTIAKEYFQLQTLRLDLNGQPKLQGNVFIPVSPSRIRATGDFFAAMGHDSNFDLDVTLDPIDLAELAAAVTTHPKISGKAGGIVELYGTPASLEGKTDFHLRDFVFANEPRVSADLETRISRGTIAVKANAITTGSDPIKLEASIPFQLEQRNAGYALAADGPFSASVDFPAVFVAKSPRYVARGILVDGILSGRLTASGSLGHPRVMGELQLIDGKFTDGRSISSRTTFQGQTAKIDFIHVTQSDLSYSARGEIHFKDLRDLAIRIRPSVPAMELTTLELGDCVSGIELSSLTAAQPRRQPIEELAFRGSLFTRDWTISLSGNRAVNPLQAIQENDQPQTFSFCHDSQSPARTLTLGIAPPPFF